MLLPWLQRQLQQQQQKTAQQQQQWLMQALWLLLLLLLQRVGLGVLIVRLLHCLLSCCWQQLN
jgi:hypothetical protein